MKRFTLTHVVRASALLIGMTLAACSGTQPAAPAPVEAVAPAEKTGMTQPAAALSSLFEATTLQLGEVLLNGMVTQVSQDQVVVGQMPIRFDSQSSLPAGLKVGDRVEVLAIVLPDDSRYAVQVVPAAASAGIPATGSATPSADDSGKSRSSEGEFKMYGVVQSINGGQLIVSDQIVQVDPAFLNGITVGSIVEVEGNLVSGTLVASEIHLEDNLHNGQDDSRGKSGSDDGPNHDLNDDKGGSTPGAGMDDGSSTPVPGTVITDDRGGGTSGNDDGPAHNTNDDNGGGNSGSGKGGKK